MTKLSNDAIAKLREHDADLRAIADADLPISWAAAAYLDALREADDHTTERGGQQ